MPLRDHFRSPVDDKHSWDGLHAGWPMVIVMQLVKVLPERYFSIPSVHLGTAYEIDIATFRDKDQEFTDIDSSEGGVAVATYAPPKPTRTMVPELFDQACYEVRIYDERRNRELVAAIEIISPSNQDRPDNRLKFLSKVISLLESGICVSMIDLVSTSDFNLYAELLETISCYDPALGDEPPPMYAVTMKYRRENDKQFLDSWYYPLSIGQPLPTLPILLRKGFAVSLELEPSYEETCRILRIK